jgi:ABC-type lipoprotein release transport system permease subunit
LAVGLFMWTALTRALSALLFDVSRLDPGVMLQVLLLLLAAALAASGLPVMRAARIDPAIALRAE